MTDAQIIELDVTGLSSAEIEDIRTHIKSKQPGPDTYFSPEHGWTCFHCGGTFHTVEGAKLHFGGPPAELPLCRKMAAELESLRAALEPFAECADLYQRSHEKSAQHHRDEGRPAPLPHSDSYSIPIKIGHCRRAREALK